MIASYYEQIEQLRIKVEQDFEFYRKMNSLIDRRLNELGKRNIWSDADEMAELAEQKAMVKDASLRLLPLRDLFKNGWGEVVERKKKFEKYNCE
ncbi:hypothetical protein [Paraliobacillus salinarum]|uniref:hypothetical protein n=1 Tax=Paraliobacillus salinarum TaxID=1158996 RepID=UPI0015F47E9E|nr:hypothetical protein [Paraliobacillus salinarum]